MNAEDVPCRDKDSTVDLAACLNDAYKAADKKLNQVYGAAHKALQLDEQRALLNAERLWVQYRDADCSAERGLYGGGTGSGPAYLACLEFQTRQRIDGLHTAYDWRLGK
jgi:uncharacterized protein YecT (DUF1311 family)